MPSPIGHAIAGLTVHVLTAQDDAAYRDRARAALLVGAAVAPDLDLLLRFADGHNHHRMQSHGIGAALLSGLVAYALWRLRRGARPAALGIAVGGAWLSHVLLDWLGRDTAPPLGLMALWPLSNGWYQCPWSLFLDIGRTLEWHTVGHNALAAAWECAVLLPLLWLVARERFQRERSRGARF